HRERRKGFPACWKRIRSEKRLSGVVPSIVPIPIEKVQGTVSASGQDLLAVEEPLQLRLNYVAEGVHQEEDLSITMRTPGHDFEFAAGFLYTEGILQSVDQIIEIKYTGPAAHPKQIRNTVTVFLKPDIGFNMDRLKRHFYVTSSCGVCGKASIESIREIARTVLS